MKNYPSCLAAVLLLFGGIGFAEMAKAADAPFAGKSIRLIVPFGAGGGYDLLGRLMSRRMPDYISGKPSVVVQNMPGAGGRVGDNYLYKIAKPDGLTFGMINSSQAIAKLTEEPGIHFEVEKFTWIGAVDTGPIVLAVRNDLNYKSLEDFKKATKQLFIGASTMSDTTYDYPAILNEYGGLRFKIVTGYGTRAASLALEKKEVDGRAGSLPTVSRFSKDVVTIRIGNARAKKVIPDIISDVDIVTSEEGRNLLDAISLPQEFSKGIIAPPNIPANRSKALRDAWGKLIQDKKFLSEAERLKIANPNDFIRAEKAEELLAKLYSLPKATWKKLITVRKNANHTVRKKTKKK